MKKDAWAQIHKTINGREPERKPILLRTLKKPITTVVYPTPTKNQEVAWLVWSGNRQSVPVIAIEIGSFNIWASIDRVFNKVLFETRTMASMPTVEVKFHITWRHIFYPRNRGSYNHPLSYKWWHPVVSQWIKQTFDTVFRPGKTTHFKTVELGITSHLFLLCHAHFSDLNIEGTQPNVHDNVVESKIIQEQQAYFHVCKLLSHPIQLPAGLDIVKQNVTTSTEQV